MKKLLVKLSLIRVLALARHRTGALSQLGWLDNKPLQPDSRGVFRPWWVYGAIDFVEHSVPPEAQILELGSGSSTVFWFKRGNKVVSVESDKDWHRRLDCLLNKLGSNVELILGDTEVTVSNFPVTSRFDVIVIDHFTEGSRSDVIDDCLPLLKEGGLVIWDNSDREDASVGRSKLNSLGFTEYKFFGLGPYNSYASQTSVFSTSFPTVTWSISPKATIAY